MAASEVKVLRCGSGCRDRDVDPRRRHDCRRGRAVVGIPIGALAKVASALAAPANYFEMTFNAQAGIPYHLWMRGKADKNSWANDSVYVQFSGAADARGAALYRIGTDGGQHRSVSRRHQCRRRRLGLRPTTSMARWLPHSTLRPPVRRPFAYRFAKMDCRSTRSLLSSSSYLDAGPRRVEERHDDSPALMARGAGSTPQLAAVGTALRALDRVDVGSRILAILAGPGQTARRCQPGRLLLKPERVPSQIRRWCPSDSVTSTRCRRSTASSLPTC